MRTPAGSSLSYRIVRLVVEVAWWGALGLSVVLLVLAPRGGVFRYRTPVSIQVDEPSFRIVEVYEGVPTSAEVVPQDLRGFLMAGTGSGVAGWLVLGGGCRVVLSVLWLVRAVIRSLREAPFDRRNVARIRMIAFVLLGAQVALPFVARMQSSWVAENLQVVGARLSVPTAFQLDDLLYPLLLLVLAEVFGRGARIEEDQALTV